MIVPCKLSPLFIGGLDSLAFCFKIAKKVF